MLPLFLDLHEGHVVVFGGGGVGYRKAAFFAKEAKVTVVSRTFDASFENKKFDLVKEDVQDRLEYWVGQADLIVAATDSSEINRSIEEECGRQGKWCNNALGVSGFLIPSVVERDGYTVCVSTLGRSPAMSRFIRSMLDGALPPEFSAMVGLQEELRALAKKMMVDQNSRERYLWDVLQDEKIWQAVRAGDMDAARKMAVARMV